MDSKLFVFFIVFLTQTGFSQNLDIGIITKFSINDFRETEEKQFNALVGYGIGIFYEEKFKDANWGYYNEISFLRKGAKYESNGNSEFLIDSKFIDIKVILNRLFKLNDEKNESVTIGLGSYFGPRIHTKETYKIDGTEIEEFDEIADTDYDAGLLINIGYSIRKVKIYGRSALGLINVFGDNENDTKSYHTEIFSLNIGYTLN